MSEPERLGDAVDRSDNASGGTDHELTVTFEDGQAKVIRSNLRLVGSDAVFEVENRTAELVAQIREWDIDGIVTEVEKLLFIDEVVR